MCHRYHAQDPRSMQLRFHTQTAGVSLTAQQPELNIARVAIEALAGVLGGTQSMHTDSFDEALALPSEKAARLALRTQQVIAAETGVANVADPLGGSYFLEALTDELEAQAEEIFAYLEKAGDGSMLDGVISAIEDGWFQSEIADAAFAFQRKVNSGEWIMVGVNGYTDGDEAQPPLLRIEPLVEEEQVAALTRVKSARSSQAVAESIARIATDAQDSSVNLMPALIEAGRRYVTLGEVVRSLEGVFGTWSEPMAL
jgi:methylmalonyl-CoA mutase N-terminal domain/subunit